MTLLLLLLLLLLYEKIRLGISYVNRPLKAVDLHEMPSLVVFFLFLFFFFSEKYKKNNKIKYKIKK